MEPEIRATEYFCPTCPESLLVYAERSQTIHDVYIPLEKKIVTLIFDVCYCPQCEGSLWVQRARTPASE
jgi:uncharacterized protein YbaR (Trm112 family)